MKSLLLSVAILFLSVPVFALDHSHSAWDSLLKKHVRNGLVNYKNIRADLPSLDAFLTSLSSVSEAEYNGFNQPQKMSFLINAYNAFTVKLILDHYPLKSITEIGSPFSKINLARGTPWKKEFFELLGKKRHLDWIEHEKLRKDFSEPRIHFAIVCASIGCPILSSSAYKPETLTQQLQNAKLNFLQTPSKNRYEKERNVLYLSSIFDWFKSDFIHNTTLIEFVQDGFNEKIKPDAFIEYTEYSWMLNEEK